METAERESENETTRTEKMMSGSEASFSQDNQPGQERAVIPDRIALFRIREAQVFVSLVDSGKQPWNLPAQGLVLPMGVEIGSYGNMARALRNALDPGLWDRLLERIKEKTGGEIEPLKPACVPLDDPELGPALLPNAPRDANGQPARCYVIAATVGRLTDPKETRGVAEAIVRTAARENVQRLILPMMGTGRGQFRGEDAEVAEAMVRGVYKALMSLHQRAMTEITITTVNQPTFEAIQKNANQLINTLPQRLESDQPAQQDLLGISDEVGALAEALLLQRVEPPLAVGILGSWGSGKTTVMNLIRRRMTEIRGLASPGWPQELDARPDTPYVGHVYLIHFNAWTYAKSSLWASLMHTIFFELSRQLTLEENLAKALAQIEFDAEDGSEQKESEEVRKKELKKQVLLKEDHRLWPILCASEDEANSQLLHTELGRQVLERWKSDGFATDALWTYLQERVIDERKRLDDLRRQLAEARHKLAARVHWEPVFAKLQKVLARSAWEKLQQQVDSEDADALEELGKVTPSVLDSLNSALQHPVETAAFLLFAACVAALPWLLNQTAWQWPAGVVTAVTLLAGYARTFLRVRNTLNSIRAEYQESVEAEQARLQTGEGPLLEPSRWRKLRQDVADLETEVQRQEQKVGLTSRHPSVLEFLQARLEEGFYEKQLGLMHCVECDLQNLTDALYIHSGFDPDIESKRERFPRGQPRVVLFIDDLDRCPPHKVVEVLESVQLLLKTELFIVVLGLDTRYVTRALEKAYAGILRWEGDPSALDYIEKILTFAYRVKPVRKDSTATFLEGLGLEVVGAPAVTGSETRGGIQAGSDGGPESVDPVAQRSQVGNIGALALQPAVVTFTSEEYERIQYVLEQIQLTPRAIKRIGNVMKLIRIFWHRTDTSPEPRMVQTVAALLALSARYPRAMCDAFVEMDARYQETPPSTQTWRQFFQDFLARHGEDNQHIRAWKKQMEADVEEVLPSEAKLTDLDLRSLDLTRSFSWVGDPTPTVT